MESKMYFGGVEGGATHSNLVICDQTGKIVGKSHGPGTNHWAFGIEECANRIIAMLRSAKIDAGIPEEKPLNSLGLTLSGCEQDSTNAELAARVKEKDINCAKEIYVASDTAGSLFTGAPRGGMVVIAGTGSNALLRTSEGDQHGCGGWGHLLGDEGGAYWIAHRAVKSVFDEVDGLRPATHPIDRVWETLCEYFNATCRADMLPHAYKHFDKPKFAGATLYLSKLASSGDYLARHLFAEAGACLAAHIVALSRHSTEKSLRVVCVGSVWRSWEFLKPGALKELRNRGVNIELEFVKLRVSSAMGAAWLAAKHVDYELPRDDFAFCEVFYTYRPEEQVNGKFNGSMKGDHATNGISGCGCENFTWSYGSSEKSIHYSGAPMSHL